MKKILIITIIIVLISGCAGKKLLTITHKETGVSVTVSEDGIEDIAIGSTLDFGDITIEATEIEK